MPPKPPPTRRPSASAQPSPAAIEPSESPQLSVAVPHFEPPRLVINAVEGWGKTSLAAYSPTPAILMAEGETGYDTLLGVGSVPSVATAHLATWESLLVLLDNWPAGYETIVFDAMGGFERLCHELVCARDFNGEWGERGFAAYQKGYDLSINEWLKLLARLDRIRAEHGTTIVFLSHCRIKTFKNPLGPDYDRWCSDCHDKTWAVTHKWADAVLFGNFFTVVEGGDKARKGKGIGGTERVLYTERRDAWDAKSRYGLPEEIDIPDTPSETWATIWSAITARKGPE